ncbi:hypothetical protein [Leptothrix ochracea]|uniref:hypothetical protein n=1 Tax=Leptothrix ochracea TaxID=735331 RepID=UPI0012EA8EAA|nr:hypothetical protein [Leptothrix ochracea]
MAFIAKKKPLSFIPPEMGVFPEKHSPSRLLQIARHLTASSCHGDEQAKSRRLAFRLALKKGFFPSKSM